MYIYLQTELHTSKLVTYPKPFAHLTLIVIILVTECTNFILRVNVMSQSNFSVNVKGQIKIGQPELAEGSSLPYFMKASPFYCLPSSLFSSFVQPPQQPHHTHTHTHTHTLTHTHTHTHTNTHFLLTCFCG